MILYCILKRWKPKEQFLEGPKLRFYHFTGIQKIVILDFRGIFKTKEKKTIESKIKIRLFYRDKKKRQ